MIETTSSQSRYPEQRTQSTQTQNNAASATDTITCSICQAVYATSPAQRPFLQATPIALEGVFMSICHFCFRCRRPACPQCWDAVHGVCGACVEEARLPFRAEVAPLDGMLFSPFHQIPMPLPQEDEGAMSLLICVSPGRFQAAAQPFDLDSAPVEPAQVAAVAAPPDAEQEQYIPDTTQSPQEVVPTEVRTGNTRAGDTNVQRKSRPRILKIFERVLLMITLLVLLSIAALIALAEYSAPANSQIVHLLHIDIRAEIAYLWQVLQQIFKR